MNFIEREKLYKEVKEANKENASGAKNVVAQKTSPEKDQVKTPSKAVENHNPPRGRQQKP